MQILLNLIVFYNEVLAFTECQKSILTVRYGTRCPKDATSWQMAANKINCDSIQQECSKSLGLDPQRFIFQYHCLINSWMNATVEVCALNRSILGYCSEFNTNGALIQENYGADCRKYDPPCPQIYNSAEAYKYQPCYDLVYKRHRNPVYVSQRLSSSSQKSTSNDCMPILHCFLITFHVFLFKWLIRYIMNTIWNIKRICFDIETSTMKNAKMIYRSIFRYKRTSYM